MKLGTIVVATDTNPLYLDFIPNFIKSWKTLVPEADIHIVLIADSIPEKFQEYSQYIKLFSPIPGMHTAFQAQCIRLLYPREVSRNEGVLITDMDILPMRRSYYTDTISAISDDAFVVYRDVCLPGEISMCYNIAHPCTWSGVFGVEDTRSILTQWYTSTNYDGNHGGLGWGTDQVILVKMFNAWNGPKVIMNDTITRFARLDRVNPGAFSDRNTLKIRIENEEYADYHCLRPYSDYSEMNNFVVNCLPNKMNAFSFCLYGPVDPKYYVGMLENLTLAMWHFPTWNVFIYIGADVPETEVAKLKQYPNAIIRYTGELGAKNMIHRFFAIDEPGIGIMMVRDADSRIHWKDRWAINEFVKSTSGLHIIRDHIQHTAPILGGLWGMRKSLGINMASEYNNYREEAGLGWRWAHDQNFLADVIYKRFKENALVHHSNGKVDISEHAFEFPVTWSEDIYCGKVEEPSRFKDMIGTQRPTKPLSFLPTVITKFSR